MYSARREKEGVTRANLRPSRTARSTGAIYCSEHQPSAAATVGGANFRVFGTRQTERRKSGFHPGSMASVPVGFRSLGSRSGPVRKTRRRSRLAASNRLRRCRGDRGCAWCGGANISASMASICRSSAGSRAASFMAAIVWSGATASRWGSQSSKAK